MKETNQNALAAERLLSASTDGLIHFGLLTGVLYLISLSTNRNMFLDSMLNGLIFFSTASLVLSLIQTILTSSIGGSIGKILGGLQVLNRNTNKLISFKRALFRYIVKITLSSKVLWIGYLWIMIHHERLSWHDMAANTKVIRTAKLGWLVNLIAVISLVVLNVILVQQTLLSFMANSNVYTNLILDLRNFL